MKVVKGDMVHVSVELPVEMAEVVREAAEWHEAHRFDLRDPEWGLPIGMLAWNGFVVDGDATDFHPCSALSFGAEPEPDMDGEATQELYNEWYELQDDYLRHLRNLPEPGPEVIAYRTAQCEWEKKRGELEKARPERPEAA